MRITIGTTTRRIDLFNRAGWITLSFGKSGPGWGSFRNIELFPIGETARACARARRSRRACRRQGHIWRHAPDPLPEEDLDAGFTNHRKYRCEDCGRREDHPYFPARLGSVRSSDS